MEKYFIVTEESRLHKDYFKYKENAKLVNKQVNDFFSENGIEASDYHASNAAIYIVPTTNDVENFKNLLNQPLVNGLRKFKSNSKINKAWLKKLKDNVLSVIDRPMLMFYFKSAAGKSRSRMFDHEGVLYVSIDPAREASDGFQEIKASEFFKVIESITDDR